MQSHDIGRYKKELSELGDNIAGLREAVGINSSLLVLGKCITALSEGRRHVPELV